MAVRLRMKKMGRTHRPFFRICAADSRSPRDGRVIEELGTYDPMILDTDARVTLNQERVAYWLSVGAQPSEKVNALIKKYGPNGTRLKQQEEAQAKLKIAKPLAPLGAPPVAPTPAKTEEPKAEEATSEEATAETSEAPAAEASETAPASEES